MQRSRYPGPVALVWALVTGLLAGCAPSQATSPDETPFQERRQGLSGSEPYLVRDLNPAGLGSRPEGGAVAARGTLFFVRNTFDTHPELWKSDGTQAGTLVVKRFQSGTNSLKLLQAVAGTVFFQDVFRQTLWKSDGTEAGTVRLTPLASEADMGNLPLVQDSAVLNGKLYLLTATSLWVSDGTAAGTVILKNHPGDGTLLLSGKMVAANGLLFFTVYPASGGAELWKSDGTAAGTVSLGAISNEPASSRYPTNELVAVNSTVFVTAYANRLWSLWKSDGTAEGTTLVHDNLEFIGGLTASNGRLYYATSTALWTTDGTKAGTLSLTSRSVPAQSLMATSGGLLFTLNQDAAGMQLWRSNGTLAGTVPLGDPCPATPYGNTNRLPGAKGVAFFSVSCGTAENWLWKSDGTPAGTVRVTDTSLKTNSSGLFGTDDAISVDIDGTLFFWADDDRRGAELWKSDGTATGTVLVRDINPAMASSTPHDFVAMGGSVFFTADDGRNGLGLWKSDGTAGGTVRLTGVSPWDNTALLTPVNGTLFFAQSSGQLWKSNGTAAGTSLVKHFTSSTSYSVKLLALVDFGGTLFFALQDDHRTELWKSDGTEAGTVRVKVLPLLSGFGVAQVAWPRVINGSLFFIVGDVSHHAELWKSDGTEAGTVPVKTLWDEPAGYQSRVNSVVVVNGQYFVLANPKLWRSDGSGPGTIELPDVAERVRPIALAEAGGTLLLISSERDAMGLWKSDGTAAGTVRLRSLVSAGSEFPDIRASATVRGRLYLTLYSPERKDYELWRSDGTVAGTGLVHPMELGSRYLLGSTRPPLLFAETDQHFFFVRDGGQGRELWARPLAPVECPFPTLVVQAAGPEGSRVEYPSVRRAEDVDPALPITYSLASGSQFPLGDTSVTLTASDPAYLADTCTFTVSVQDSLGPSVQCPMDVTANAPLGKDSMSVQYPPATATDLVSTPALVYSHPSGSTFRTGSTSVEVKATDAAGNTTTCVFKVDVGTPLQGCGCGSTSPAAALGWLMVLVPLVLRRRGARGEA